MSRTKTWMPLYVADYIADTTHLSTSQHGAYLLLLICQWRTGPLLDNDEQLARMCRASLDEWRDHLAPTVRPLFTILEDGRLSQTRLALEKGKAERLSKRRAEAGKEGGTAKQRNTTNVAIATGLPSALREQKTLQIPTPSPLPSPSQKEREEGELRSPVEKTLVRAKASEDEPPGFVEWYAIYPRKDAGRKEPLKAWRRAIASGASEATLIEGLRRYRFSPDPEMRPMATTWLNHRRWDAQYDTPEVQATPRQLNPANLTGAAAMLYRLQENPAAADEGKIPTDPKGWLLNG